MPDLKRISVKKLCELTLVAFLLFFPYVVVSTSVQFLPLHNLTATSNSSGEVIIDGINYYVLVGNLHTHTTYSDGRNSPLSMVTASRERGFDFIAITDHNQIQGALEAKEETEKYGIHTIIIIGEEVTTNWGHLLALNINQLISPTVEPNGTCTAIHNQGGYAIPAHPLLYWNGSVFKSLIESHQVDAYEAYNSGHNYTLAALSATPMVAEYPFVADSDAHTAGQLGSSKTIVFSVNRTINGIFDAILNHRTVAESNGQYAGNSTLVNILEEHSEMLQAKITIGSAEATIVRAKTSLIQMDLSQAESLLDAALDDYWAENYSEAVAAAQQAQNIARTPIYIQIGIMITAIGIPIIVVAVVAVRRLRRRTRFKEAVTKNEVPSDLDLNKF